MALLALMHNPDEYIELPTLIERARVNARFIELWAEKFDGQAREVTPYRCMALWSVSC